MSLHYQLHKPDPLRVLILSLVCSSQTLLLPGREKVGKECEVRSCSKEPLKISGPKRTASATICTDPSAVNKTASSTEVEASLQHSLEQFSHCDMDSERKDRHDEVSNPTWWS